MNPTIVSARDPALVPPRDATVPMIAPQAGDATAPVFYTNRWFWDRNETPHRAYLSRLDDMVEATKVLCQPPGGVAVFFAPPFVVATAAPPATHVDAVVCDSACTQPHARSAYPHLVAFVSPTDAAVYHLSVGRRTLRIVRPGDPETTAAAAKQSVVDAAFGWMRAQTDAAPPGASTA